MWCLTIKLQADMPEFLQVRVTAVPRLFDTKTGVSARTPLPGLVVLLFDTPGQGKKLFHYLIAVADGAVADAMARDSTESELHIRTANFFNKRMCICIHTTDIKSRNRN